MRRRILRVEVLKSRIYVYGPEPHISQTDFRDELPYQDGESHGRANALCTSLCNRGRGSTVAARSRRRAYSMRRRNVTHSCPYGWFAPEGHKLKGVPELVIDPALTATSYEASQKGNTPQRMTSRDHGDREGNRHRLHTMAYHCCGSLEKSVCQPRGAEEGYTSPLHVELAGIAKSRGSQGVCLRPATRHDTTQQNRIWRGKPTSLGPRSAGTALLRPGEGHDQCKLFL